jgi:hypothetical protein
VRGSPSLALGKIIGAILFAGPSSALVTDVFARVFFTSLSLSFSLLLPLSSYYVQGLLCVFKVPKKTAVALIVVTFLKVSRGGG